jgi:Fur family peroxide stress response transcriptional regulator
VDLLRASASHPSALELYQEIRTEFPSASLGNVYRNLNILVEQGEIRRLGSGSGSDRFEYGREDHAHFICNSCGVIQDLELPEIASFVTDTTRRTGGSVEEVRVDLYGLCERCQGSQA